MPELPDIAAYITAPEPRILGEPIEHVRLASPFLLRTVEPPLASVEGRRVRELRRIGKRIAIGVEDDLWLVLSDDRWPAALAVGRSKLGRPQSTGGF
jgi:formamidopyrimidine-DNA glycosylase